VGGAGGEADAVEPIRSPFKKADDAICIARGQLPLPAIHPASVQSGHDFGRLSVANIKKPRAGGWFRAGRRSPTGCNSPKTMQYPLKTLVHASRQSVVRL